MCNCNAFYDCCVACPATFHAIHDLCVRATHIIGIESTCRAV